jgi:hypothetical protein
MKKILLGLLAAVTMVSCTDDVYAPSYSIKYKTNQLNGDYSIVTPDEDFMARFTYNYLDTATNYSFNLFQVEVAANYRTYEFVEVIENGISTFEVRMKALDVINGELVFGDNVYIYEVQSFVLEDNIVQSMDVLTPSGVPSTLTLVE